VARLEAAQSGLTDRSVVCAGVVRPMLRRLARIQGRAVFTRNIIKGPGLRRGAAFQVALKTPVSYSVGRCRTIGAAQCVIAEARPIESGGKHYLHARLGGSGNETLERTLRVKRSARLGDLSQRVTIAPVHFFVLNLPIPERHDLKGKLAELELEPAATPCPDDESIRLNLDARGGVHVLLFDKETTQIESLQPGFHLRMALEALS